MLSGMPLKDAQFPIYEKLATPTMSGKAQVHAIVERIKGKKPSSATLNMWSTRGRIPYRFQIQLIEECRRRNIETSPADFERRS